MDGKDGISVVDILVLFGIPFLASAAASKFSIDISDAILSSLLVGFSIIFGFQLNVQVLIFSISQKDMQEELKNFISELFSNVSFSILLSLVCLLLTLGLMFLDEKSSPRPYLVVFLVYFSVALLLNVLMVFKRVHVALISQLDG